MKKMKINIFFILYFSLQCPFIDMPMENGDISSIFNADLISNAMKLLVESITHRIGFLNEYQSIMNPSDPDIRYLFIDTPILLYFL